MVGVGGIGVPLGSLPAPPPKPALPEGDSGCPQYPESMLRWNNPVESWGLLFPRAGPQAHQKRSTLLETQVDGGVTKDKQLPMERDGPGLGPAPHTLGGHGSGGSNSTGGRSPGLASQPTGGPPIRRKHQCPPRQRPTPIPQLLGLGWHKSELEGEIPAMARIPFLEEWVEFHTERLGEGIRSGGSRAGQWGKGSPSRKT